MLLNSTLKNGKFSVTHILQLKKKNSNMQNFTLRLLLLIHHCVTLDILHSSQHSTLPVNGSSFIHLLAILLQCKQIIEGTEDSDYAHACVGSKIP